MKSRRQPGFALATTIILLAVALVASTTLVVVLARSLRLTRAHTEALRAFYVAEAGKSYAMWKVSSLNDGSDAAHLADCLTKDSQCPGGLNTSWSLALPGDANSTFTVTAASTANSGEALISSIGKRNQGNPVYQRRTEIKAYKPIRQVEQNDLAYNWAMLADQGINPGGGGDLTVSSAAGQPIAGIHSNAHINNYGGRLTVAGPITTNYNIIAMPSIGNNEKTFISGTSIRAQSCGWSGCNQVYNQSPMYCWTNTCSGFVGQVDLPGIDINSAGDTSYKTIARNWESQNPGQKAFYTNSQLEKALDDAGQTGGWVELPGPITYVSGDFDIAYTDKLKVHGMLVVQGNLEVGWPDRNPYYNCSFSACPANVSLQVLATDMNGSTVVPGLLVTGQLSFGVYAINSSVDGLIYAQNGFAVSNLRAGTLTTRGVIIARWYSNGSAVNYPNNSFPQHTAIYDATNLQLLFHGPLAIYNLTTSYTGYWEEQY